MGKKQSLQWFFSPTVGWLRDPFGWSKRIRDLNGLVADLFGLVLANRVTEAMQRTGRLAPDSCVLFEGPFLEWFTWWSSCWLFLAGLSKSIGLVSLPPAE